MLNFQPKSQVQIMPLLRLQKVIVKPEKDWNFQFIGGAGDDYIWNEEFDDEVEIEGYVPPS